MPKFFPKTVIFDLDGTLVDSVPDLTLALNAALLQGGLLEVSEDQVRLWVGNGSAKLIERAVLSLGVDAEVCTAIHGYFLKYYQSFLCEKSGLYPEVKTLLSALKAQGINMGLVTNKPYEFVPPLLNTLGIAEYFDIVLGGDSLAFKKPHPQPLQKVAEHFNVKTSDCMMVGDSSSDIKAAQQASMPCVLLLQGYNQGQDLTLLGPDYCFEDIKALHQFWF